VLGPNGRLPEALGLLVRELNAAPGLVRDRQARSPRRLNPDLVEQVPVRTMRGLLGHAERAGDLAPGCAGVESPLDDLGLGGVELASERGESPQRGLRVGDLNRLSSEQLDRRGTRHGRPLPARRET
jgi:hypothetical protein